MSLHSLILSVVLIIHQELFSPNKEAHNSQDVWYLYQTHKNEVAQVNSGDVIEQTQGSYCQQTSYTLTSFLSEDGGYSNRLW